MGLIFNGFNENKKRFTGIPDQFFSEILPIIQDLNELKVVLYLLWSAYTEGDFSLGFTAEDLLQDKKFVPGLDGDQKRPLELLSNALEKAISDNILIGVSKNQKIQKHFFINTPRGRAAAEQFLNQGSDQEPSRLKTTLDVIKPNIFRLYEENIGPLTPLIAETLKDAQNTYPEDWIDEAIQIAIKNNVRRWKYIESILKRWLEEGRDGTDRRNTQEDYERYLKGEYGDIGKHW